MSKEYSERSWKGINDRFIRLLRHQLNLFIVLRVQHHRKWMVLYRTSLCSEFLVKQLLTVYQDWKLCLWCIQLLLFQYEKTVAFLLSAFGQELQPESISCKEGNRICTWMSDVEQLFGIGDSIYLLREHHN